MIMDLALLLTTAGIATILCKKLNQPLVLGYVLAGILVGPAIGWLPNIGDPQSISTWADIGVVFLMFGLGLEFSIVKLATVGKPAFITAFTEMALMIGVGILCGFVLGWGFYTCLFLGGMLAISSTTIIIKALEDLGLKDKGYTKLIFGALVVEDIIGIFLMVLLSTIAVGNGADGAQIALHIGVMLLYLILWFALSVVLIPSLLKMVSRFLNDEIILIVSLALCLCMVLLANYIGFSSALGAFIAGSILAGTVHVHRIEKLFKPVKDLFGAVFFVSVGMMVSPLMIWQNIIPIIVITLVVIIGKPIFTTLGALLSRQSLADSLRCGTSLSQIGEFSFIIAALGVTLGVTSDFLYPVIVAVSIITTLITPFYIKHADTVVNMLEKILPAALLARIEKRQSVGAPSKKENPLSGFIKQQAMRAIMVVLAALISVEILAPLIRALIGQFLPEPILALLLEFIAFLITGIFISNLSGRNEKNSIIRILAYSKKNRIPVGASLTVSFLLALGAVFYVLFRIGGVATVWLLIPALIITRFISYSKAFHIRFLRLENIFIGNLNEEIMVEHQKNQSAQDRLSEIEDRFYVVVTQLDQNNFYRFGEQLLRGSLRNRQTRKQMRKRMAQQRAQMDPSLQGKRPFNEMAVAYGANLDLIVIIREGKILNKHDLYRPFDRNSRRQMSQGHNLQRIKSGDKLVYLGTKEAADSFFVNLKTFGRQSGEASQAIPLAQYLSDPQSDLRGLSVISKRIERGSSLKVSSIRDYLAACAGAYKVLEVERNLIPVINPGPDFKLLSGDTVWLLGSFPSTDTATL